MAASLGVTPVVVPHETLDQAVELGLISPGVSLRENGLDRRRARGRRRRGLVQLHARRPRPRPVRALRQDPSSSFNGVLSLFNNDPLSYDYGDLYDLDGHRLLDQVDGKADGGVASFDQLLGQGTYYLAVSGDGNFDFHPLIAGSGLPGSTGDFSCRSPSPTPGSRRPPARRS